MSDPNDAGWGYRWEPWAPPPQYPGPATPAAGASRPSRRGALLVAAAAWTLAAGVLGALAGHISWHSSEANASGSPSAAGNPPSGSFLPPDAFGGGQAPSGSPNGPGAPANIAALAAKIDPALVDINLSFGAQNATGSGTGIVITPGGEILTNNHVIDGATRISVTDVGNARTYQADVVGYAPSSDVAVLQLLGASGLRTATLGDSSKLAVGSAVVAAGNAGGTGGTPSASGGSVTALDQSITASDSLDGTTEQLSGLIELNADVQPGDSGGAVVDSAGAVVGMTTAASSSYSFDGGSSQGFAIPINQAMALVRQIVAGRSSARVHIGPTAFLGVLVAPSGRSGFGYYYGGGIAGADVTGVLPGEPAASAGITAGDVITALDGQAVSSSTQLSEMLIPHHPGDQVQVSWSDSYGRTHSATIRLASGPPA